MSKSLEELHADTFQFMNVSVTEHQAVRALNYMIGYASVNPDVPAIALVERGLRHAGVI